MRLASIIKRFATRSAIHQPASKTAIDSIVDQLEALNRGTEQDFLAVGARLMKLLQTTSAIASGINSAVQSPGDDATAALTTALERCHTLAAATTEGRTHLTALRTGATQISSIFGGFRQAVASFHVVCTMTRIEAARLGGAGDELSSLTDEVLTLARRMQSQVEHVLASSSAVDAQTAHLAIHLREADQLLDHLDHTVPNVLRSLNTFAVQQASAVELSTELAADSRAIAHILMGAVTSIQFHDITRQQVEHVISALRHLATQRCPTAKALDLEARQLASAANTFGDSVARLWRNLENIASAVLAMSTKGDTLVLGGGTDTAFFLELHHCLDAIAEATTAHHTASIATRTATQALTEPLATMNRAAAEIRELDIHLLRVALNANLRAAHLGHRGDTLAILASALRDLATSANDRSKQALTALQDMDATVVCLLAPRPAPDPDLPTTMRATIEALQSTSNKASHRLAEIATSARDLSAGIATARDNFQAGRLFDQTIPRCLAQLQHLAVEANGQPDTLDIIDTFTRHYTMQSERDIHASLSQTPQLVTAGDDIELF